MQSEVVIRRWDRDQLHPSDPLLSMQRCVYISITIIVDVAVYKLYIKALNFVCCLF